MIDALDKQTQALPFEPVKRGRGRPKTGKAMTPAEKQRAYRERQKGASSKKGNVTEKHELPDWAESYSAWVDELCRRMRIIEDERVRLLGEIRELKSQKPVTKTVPGNGVWTLRFKLPGSRKWTYCEPQIDFEGVAWGFEATAQHTREMQATAGKGFTWQAVRDDGLIYDPKAAK